MFLTINNLNKSFINKGSSELVLSNINLDVREGEFVSILGPSGCGKSTLLSIVAGLTSASEGNIELSGTPIKGPGKERGMVFQQAALFPWLTVLENVMFPLLPVMSKKEAAEKAKHYLQMVQLGSYTNHSPHEISGGMQQRVAIARALAMDPALLLMDEPFGALDEQTRSRLHEILENIFIETKKTILFVTHSIAESLKLSDRIVVMGTQPGTILDIIELDFPRPRSQSKEELLSYEEKIQALLKSEIDKVTEKEQKHAASR
ncbi:ABC transporter ATP-binding protein [Jeotgalibacillus proteolyticus]|uniref:Nitrate/sulfonate/bicarbonate ABC transporter ATP-binding protein n=1 Tax=Jeotgalibacillus proteolyticus TaxID=2082395 RepID=A0A2S5GB03_9BACL|nr:ABC transporter ATP-binding protein [Jeotgalibacillus proteolyticus]PPA70148.1 nitrate/sulfonate/bicarbonate ABC transporter ATP-binding protein [Jeotgalibacillus proteolyticus]